MATQTTRRQETWSKRGTSASIPLDPINENRAPTTADAGEPGQQWLDHTANTAYTCFGPDTTGAYIWITSPTGGIAAASMTINPGNLDVTAGDITGGGACTITGLTTTGTLAAGNTAITGTLNVTALATLNNVTIVGDLNVTGDFDITDAASATVTSTFNGAGAINLMANGGINETVIFRAAQGTGADAVQVIGTAGGVRVYAATTLDLQGTGAASTINMAAGTGGMAVALANGNFALTTGTGTFDVTTTNAAITLAAGTGTTNISADASASTINIGTGAAIKTISVGGTSANVIAIGNTQTAGSVAIGDAMTTGTITIGGTGAQTGNFILAPSTGAQTITLGNNNGAKTINIGNGVSGNTISLGNGINTGAQTINIAGGAAGAASTVNIHSGAATVGVQTVNIATGTSVGGRTINIATGAATNAISIGSDAGAVNTIALGTGNGASSLALAAGTGGSTYAVTNGTLTVTAGTGTINIASDATISAVNVGTGAAAKTVTIGSNSGASQTDIYAGTNGIALISNGSTTVDSANVAAAAGPNATVTVVNNANVGRITFAGYTQAAAATLVLTLTNAQVTATSHIVHSCTVSGAEDAQMTVTKVRPGAGTVDFTITNLGADALASNLQFNYWILS